MTTVKEQKRTGKFYRKEKVSFKELCEWKPISGRDNAVELICKEEKGRIESLLPLRHERMMASPFSFFRGAAAIQAHDLAKSSGTVFNVQACGDAHISNFGVFASPERRIIFDINDFDETLPAPFECDVKRLMASIEICGRERGLSSNMREAAVEEAAAVYRKNMRRYSDMGSLDVWYAHMDIEDLIQKNAAAMDNFVQNGMPAIDERAQKTLKEMIKKALAKNHIRAIKKLTEEVDGKLRIKSDPPIVVPLRELVGDDKKDFEFDIKIKKAIDIYRQSLPVERRVLIDQYEPLEMARKVVGVGSVGMRSWILVMSGAKNGDNLVLQIKEAGSCALEKYYGKSKYAECGRRVVEGQRAIQNVGDILLGWLSFTTEEGVHKDYYVRQLWDAKGSFDLYTLKPIGIHRLGLACAWTLAHAHAKTGNRHAIAGYLGKGDDFERNMVSYARAYADQNEADYEVCRRKWSD